MKHIFMLVCAIALASIASQSHAQSSEYEAALLGQPVEARIGITIPFGGDGKSKNSKPELALMARRETSQRRNMDWAMKPDRLNPQYAETRLALTLSREPNLSLNGQALYDFGGSEAELSDGVKTAGKFALGAGLVVLAAAVVFVGVFAVTYESDDE